MNNISMQPDILFWFYKEFDLCRVRLIRLRRLNPDINIYGLYGGPASLSFEAAEKTADLLDDFYVYPHDREAKWKWKHGDQLIAEWHKDRGQYLKWQSIFVCQWDMLVTAPQASLFSSLQPGEILLSGLRPVANMGDWWNWTRPDNPNFLAFKQLMQKQYGMEEQDLMACLFIVVCFPRIFLDKYVEINHPRVGFLEYKIPSLAKAFGLTFCQQHNFLPWWPGDPEMKNWRAEKKVLAPLLQEVSKQSIQTALSKEDGPRIFHPVSMPHEDL